MSAETYLKIPENFWTESLVALVADYLAKHTGEYTLTSLSDRILKHHQTDPNRVDPEDFQKLRIRVQRAVLNVEKAGLVKVRQN